VGAAFFAAGAAFFAAVERVAVVFRAVDRAGAALAAVERVAAAFFAPVDRAGAAFFAPVDRAGAAFFAPVDRADVAFFAPVDRADVAARDALEVRVFAAGFAAADLVEDRVVRLLPAATFFTSAPARDAARFTDDSALRAVDFTAVSAFLTATFTRASAVLAAPARDDVPLLATLEPPVAFARADDDPAFARGLALRGAMVSPPSARTEWSFPLTVDQLAMRFSRRRSRSLMPPHTP
jgi:hypothetical protein